MALSCAVLVQPAMAADSTTIIRESDLIAPSDESGDASYEFLADGVRVTTNDTDSFARAHFPVGVQLSAVQAVEYDWIGTENRPGIYYDIDLDGDGAPDGQLLGEQTYGGTDVWLNRDAQDFDGSGGGAGTVDSEIPDDTFANAAPCDGSTPRAGTDDPCGSSGDQFHGTLENWATQLGSEYDDVSLVSGGFVGSGTVMDGTLQSITYGENSYRFTNAAAPKDDTQVSIMKGRPGALKPGDKVKISGNVTPVTAGSKAILQQRIAGTWTDLKDKALDNQAGGNDYVFGYTAPQKSRDYLLRVVVPPTSTSERGVSRVVTVSVS